MKITGCFKAGNGHSASPRGFPAFQHPVIFIRELENPPFTEKIRFLTPFLENYTNKILIYALIVSDAGNEVALVIRWFGVPVITLL